MIDRSDLPYTYYTNGKTITCKFYSRVDGIVDTVVLFSIYDPDRLVDFMNSPREHVVVLDGFVVNQLATWDSPKLLEIVSFMSLDRTGEKWSFHVGGDNRLRFSCDSVSTAMHIKLNWG